MKRRNRRMLLSALLVMSAMATDHAVAQTMSDSEKIARLERETEVLQQQLKLLKEEMAKTKKKAEKAEAAQAAATPAPASVVVPAALTAPLIDQVADIPSRPTDAGSSVVEKSKDSGMSWHGITFYGAIDVGYAYTSEGVPVSGAYYVGGDYTIYGSRYANRPVSTLTNNALQQSSVGVKFEEELWQGWAAVGKLETGFNPLSGEISDACASLLRNSGKLYAQMTVSGDGSRCGQAFNGAAYAGISSPIYGTLTFGRQNSLVLDGMAVYDPMALSYAFSILGYTGTVGPGVGSTESARWDNSVKYVLTYGPVHAAGMFTNGGQETPMVGTGYAGNVGFAWGGFAIDGYYTKENGAVNLSYIPNPAYASSGVTCVSGALPTSSEYCPNYLLGTVTNNEAWDVMAKYAWEFGGGIQGRRIQGRASPSGCEADHFRRLPACGPFEPEPPPIRV